MPAGGIIRNIAEALPIEIDPPLTGLAVRHAETLFPIARPARVNSLAVMAGIWLAIGLARVDSATVPDREASATEQVPELVLAEEGTASEAGIFRAAALETGMP